MKNNQLPVFLFSVQGCEIVTGTLNFLAFSQCLPVSQINSPLFS